MGWSCRAEARDTLRVIESACKKTRKENVSNVFYEGGKRYFYEIDEEERTDGGISGSIFLAPENAEWGRLTGRFVIDGDGRVVVGPKLFMRVNNGTDHSL